ncbi:MAG: radical SAM protein [Candidatus Omnitrophica bacterium]|nr:radical SAM protein [Candidatus Omnitrophota bacterium]MBU3934034.1 radical SAM protein [Candidatus Omnitrophota bacterium]
MKADKVKINKFFRDLGFYFSRKICYPLVSPDVLQVSLTNRCNLRCKSCNAWKIPRSSDSELTLAEIREIIEEGAEWGIKEIHLLGGEPLLKEDWDEIVLYAKKSGMFVVICTNGTLIDQEMVKSIVETKVDLISISLDGAKKETHDFLRGQSGTYDKILAGINNLNQFDENIRPKIVLILTISNKNLFELKDYIDLAYSLSAYSIYFTALVLDNVYLFSQRKTHDLWIEEKYFKDLDKIFNEIFEYAKSKGYNLNYPSFKLFPKYFRGKLSKGDWMCFTGLKRFVVTATGDIQMCGEIVANYRKTKSLRKIWTSSSAFKRRQFIKNCRNYCLQDCHARPESSSLLKIIKKGTKRLINKG